MTQDRCAVPRQAMGRHRVVLGAALLLALSACTQKPRVPDWALQAESAANRATTAYLKGDQRVQAQEWDRARQQVAGTARLDLAARIELMRCAPQVASLVPDECLAYAALAQDAAAPEQAYGRYLSGALQAADVQLLPLAQQPVAQLLLGSSVSPQAVAAAVQAVAEPLPRLVAAAVALRAGQGSAQLLDIASQTASEQAWRRPLMAWLLLQAQAHERAGQAQAAQAVRRRVDWLQSGAQTDQAKPASKAR